MSATEFGEGDAAQYYRVPVATDDKYSRGVLGVATGSSTFPGAALLGVDGALSTGIGMVRYSGPDSIGIAMVARRPEVVYDNGRVDAWVIGSGMASTDGEAMDRARFALSQGIPSVVDAGALSLLPLPGTIIATPHAGELARALGVPREEVVENPAELTLIAASRWNATVVLKGSMTHIATPAHEEFVVNLATPWLATAGTGDVLAGIIGALVASRRADIDDDPALCARLAATGVVIHSLAARRASAGGPFLLDRLIAEIPAVVRGLIER
ncbi:MAG: hypothetical protein RLZZ319_298 [Actinomycetota bacterium]